ncbi:hypothetical protein NIES22_01100 [Calothrix brevissima NIES-22]|nr:hypothetical protein NIES22_01100 [Calothrix brevissima NIES-22]
MKKLTELKFSQPIIRYETTAIHENSKGESFLVKASGYNEELIKKSIKNLRVDCEILSEESEELQNNTILSTNDQVAPKFTLADSELLNDNSDDNEVAIELSLLHPPEVAHKLKFSFTNNFIERGITDIGERNILVNEGSDNYIIRGRNPIIAEITVSGGSANFTMLEATSKNSRSWQRVAFIRVEDGSQETLTYPGNPQKYYKLKVQGQPQTEYSITGSWTVT